MASKRHSSTKELYSKSSTKTGSKNLPLSFQSPSKNGQQKENGKKAGTRVVIKYDVGFKNALFVRGKGANLSWEKGIPMKNVKADEWVWEPKGPFSHCEFKILINDVCYECGENHHLNPGMKIQFTPNF